MDAIVKSATKAAMKVNDSPKNLEDDDGTNDFNYQVTHADKLKRIVIGEKQNPHRILLNHPVAQGDDQEYWNDESHLMDFDGWKHINSFKAFKSPID